MPGRKRSNTPAKPKDTSAGGLAPGRTKIVWTALLAAMTTVSGGLYLLDRSPPSNVGGLALPALMATGAPRSIEAIYSTGQQVSADQWQAIVIHDSGSPVGSPKGLEQDAVARGLAGMGYHFVIGNGRGIGDGELHVGRRWIDQRAGAHSGGRYADWYNTHAVGICLIGDGARSGFSDAQFQRLVELTASLCRELHIPADRVLLHSEVASTSSPGRLFPAGLFREELAARLPAR